MIYLKLFGVLNRLIIKGTSEEKFSPNGLITREEAATLMDRIYNLNKDSQEAKSSKNITFSDANKISDWAMESVSKMSSKGIFIGKEGGSFDPKANITKEQTKIALLRLQNICAPKAISSLSLEKTLSEITKNTRKIGTKGAEEAGKYILERLASFGYKTKKQDFEFMDKEALKGEQISNIGTNIIAVKKASVENPDILIVSAHYDTVSGTVGANDDGSGMALLLELAKSVSDMDTDTEIRFIAFSGEEEGILGSDYYVKQLSKEEKARIMGAIELDMLGHYKSEYFQIDTTDGKDTLVGNLINEKAKEVTGEFLKENIEPASDHMAFVRGGIPEILLSQNNLGVENHKVSDNMSIIDFDKIMPNSVILYKTLEDIMSEDSKDLAEKAYEISNMMMIWTGI